MITANQFVDLALTQAGDEYEFGAEASPTDPDPDRFDCSELIEWVGRRLGVTPRIPDGSWNQATHCKVFGALVPTARALDTRGALLFRFSSSPFTGSRPAGAHVVISLGDGRTMEARSSRTTPEVGVFAGAAARGWTHAALIPGLDYSPPAGAVATHTVRPGETLRAIADLYELDGWRPLYDLNKSVIGSDPDLIRPGQVLRIPGTQVHVVAAGDTLAGIAARYGHADGWRAIYEANKSVIGSDPDLIRPGQVLIIPAG